MQMKNITRVLRPVLTAIEYAIAILIVAVSTQIIFGNNLQTWIITIISISLAVFTSIIWYSDGVDRGEQVQSVFNTTLRYNTYAKYILNLQDFDALREFCVKKNEDYRLELMALKLGEYELTLANLNKFKELREKARKTAKIGLKWHLIKYYIYDDEEYTTYIKVFSQKQVKIMEKLADKKIQFRPLQVKDITRANDKAQSLVPINTEKQVLPTRIISKIIWGVILGLFTASVVFTRKDVWTINETIQCIVWAFSISMNIYTSIRAGYKSVTINRYQYYKAKNEICIEYFAFKGIQMADVEKELEDKLKA